jgi:hypothetical protein
LRITSEYGESVNGYFLTLSFLAFDIFMFLDAINMKFMERYFFFMKIYRGKAIFIMLVAGLMFARSEVTFW